MSTRPTEDELVDFCETGRCGCLLPDIEDEPSTEGDTDDDE